MLFRGIKMTDKPKTLKEVRKEWETGIINEATIQEAVSKHGGIEFSYTGELIPLEVVDGSLREVAMDHIKNCENHENCTTHNMCGFYYDTEKKYPKPRCPIFCEVCEWIMMFFNITEEDLK